MKRMHFAFSIDYIPESVLISLANRNEVSIKVMQEHFNELKAKGVKCIPIGECDNFDDQRGCRGHPKEAEITIEMGISNDNVDKLRLQ
jgi:hypothetical protein